MTRARTQQAANSRESHPTLLTRGSNYQAIQLAWTYVHLSVYTPINLNYRTLMSDACSYRNRLNYQTQLPGYHCILVCICILARTKNRKFFSLIYDWRAAPPPSSSFRSSDGRHPYPKKERKKRETERREADFLD